MKKEFWMSPAKSTKYPDWIDEGVFSDIAYGGWKLKIFIDEKVKYAKGLGFLELELIKVYQECTKWRSKPKKDSTENG